MSEWWTYELADFKMFSPATWWRLVELYNQAFWPQPLAVTLVAAAAWVATAWRLPRADRFVLLALAAMWCWVAWAFHWQRLQQIHLAAPYLAGAAALQGALLGAAALLAWRAAPREGIPAVRAAGLVLAFCAIAGYPWVGLLFGRPLAQAEMIGWMPDPTALGTLGLVLALPALAGWQRGALALLPALFLLAGALHHATMAQ